MQREILCQTSADYDAELWADYSALYAGGKAFKGRIERFLVQNPQEPVPVYVTRCREAHYRGYLGTIVDYFASYLFTSSVVVRATVDEKIVDPDPYYATLKEDCDGGGTDFVEFLRARTTEALVRKSSVWIVERPDDGGEAPRDRAEFEKRGLGKVVVRTIDRAQLLDYECDERGRLQWAVIHSCEMPRAKPTDARARITERFFVYDTSEVETFEVTYAKGDPPPKDIPSLGRRAHGFKEVPVVRLELDDALWVANRIASPQIEHFRQSNALAWSIRRTCYAMPVFNVADDTKPPVMGAGYYIMIGLEEKMAWSAPPSQPFEQIRKEIDSLKDEIFRIVHQMSLGVDNNAASVGRSALSKAADAKSIEIILHALGGPVREAVETTYDLISQARGDQYKWSIEGLDSFTEVDPTALTTAAMQAVTLDIPSPTFQREMKTRVALTFVPDVTQAVKDKIRQEIEANVTEESVLTPHVEPDGDEDDDEPTEDA